MSLLRARPTVIMPANGLRSDLVRKITTESVIALPCFPSGTCASLGSEAIGTMSVTR
jgi:hypothetical protein